MAKKGIAYIGTSGFYYSNWIGKFYPESTKKEDLLIYYQTKFNTVEINSSFYHIPRASTIENWKTKVDEEFIFVFKASRYITHLKKFNIDAELVEKVFSPLSIFANALPKHLVLLQAPANVKGNAEKLLATLELLPKTFRYAFEFRHETWFTEEIYTVLKKFNASVVLSDSPRTHGEDRQWPMHNVDTADFAYIRFHGSERLYYSSYTDMELEEYAGIIKEKQKRGLDVYCYFNNDAAGYATINALKLRELVTK